MNRVAKIAVCLAAALASSGAWGIAGAQAAPEYFRCAKKPGGNYSAKGCAASSRVEGTGKFERESATGVTYKMKSGAIVVETPQSTLDCKKSSGGGTITGPGSGTGLFSLKGCALRDGGACTTEGEPSGTIKINPLELTVGGTETAPTVAVGQTTDVASFTCELLRNQMQLLVRGSAVGNLHSPGADVASKKSTVLASGSAGLIVEAVGFTGFEPAFETGEYSVDYSAEIGIT